MDFTYWSSFVIIANRNNHNAPIRKKCTINPNVTKNRLLEHKITKLSTELSLKDYKYDTHGIILYIST